MHQGLRQKLSWNAMVCGRGDLVAIRRKVKAAAIEALANPRRQGRKHQIMPVEQYQKVSKELSETKDALAAVGHDLA